MKTRQWLTVALTPTLALALAAAPLAAGTVPRDPNLNGGVVLGPIDAPSGTDNNWIDHFDNYADGSQMHGQGGWKGWDNNSAAGALVSSTQSRSAANAVDVNTATDLVHEFTGFTTGTWTVTAWTYVPTGFSGQNWFILLNQYADLGTNNWSAQICFDSVAGTVRDSTGTACDGGTPTPIVFDQWVPIQVVIDFDTDMQTGMYNGQVIYTDSWTGHVSGGGIANLAAIDLFANSGSTVFYDDLSISNLPFFDDFESQDLQNWHSMVDTQP